MRYFDYKYFIKLLAGPIVLFVIMYLPLEGLNPKAQLCLAVYGGVIVWWMFQPIPWAATSFLPLILFPLLGIADFKTTAGIYGQSVIFLLMAVLLLGEAIKKSGLGTRFALSLMSLTIIKGSVLRFMFIYMVCTYLLASVTSLAAIPIMVPIGLATVEHIEKAYEAKGHRIGTKKLRVFVVLAALYAIIGGNIATIIHPHAILATGLLEELTGYTVTFLQWTKVGLPLGTMGVFLSFLILRVLYKPEVSEIPAGQEYFREKKEQLGKIKLAERNVLIVLVVLIILWILPSFIIIEWLSLWSVAILGMLLLFILPSNLEKKEALVSAKDLANINWNIIWLVAGGVGLAGMATELGVMDWASSMISDVAWPVLVVISGFGTGILTNFLSGVATATTMSTIVFAISADIGLHPAVLVRIIPASAVGIVFPWAGAAAGTTFAIGRIEMSDMIKTGIIVTIMYIILVTLGSIILVPLFGAFTPVS